VETAHYRHSDSSDLVLVNPMAGGGHARTIIPRLRDFAKRQCWNAVFCVTDNANDLAWNAREAARAGQKRIFVVGGDGTFHVLVNAVAYYPDTVLAVIPAGGGNDLAAALDLPSDPIAAAGQLLHGEVSFLDAASIRTAEGNHRLYLAGGGVGLDTEAVRLANSCYRNLRGRTRYVVSALRAIVRFRPITVSITLNSRESLQATVLLVSVLNTPSYGGGLFLAPNALTDDGKLDLVLLDQLNVLEVLGILPALLSQGKLRTKRIRRFQVDCARIETNSPCEFHGDGELLGMTPVEISIIPRAVRVLRAKRRDGH
jgi:diacylglycerol kinase (ATP)